MAGQEDGGSIRPGDIEGDLDLSAATEEAGRPEDRTSSPASDKLGSVAPSMAANLTLGQRLRVADVHNRTLENRRRNQPEAEWQDGGLLSQELIDKNKKIHGREGSHPADTRVKYPSIPQSHRRAFRPDTRPVRLSPQLKEMTEELAEAEESYSPMYGYTYPKHDRFSGPTIEYLEDTLASTTSPYGVSYRQPQDDFGGEEVRKNFEMAEQIASANPEFVKQIDPVEFVKLVGEVRKALELNESYEERLRTLGRTENSLREALEVGNGLDMYYAVTESLSQILGGGYITDSYFTEFLDRYAEQSLTNEELAERWANDNVVVGNDYNVFESKSYIDFENALRLHNIRRNPDATPRQQAEQAEAIIKEVRDKLAEKVEEGKRKTDLLRPKYRMTKSDE